MEKSATAAARIRCCRISPVRKASSAGRRRSDRHRAPQPGEVSRHRTDLPVPPVRCRSHNRRHARPVDGLSRFHRAPQQNECKDREAGEHQPRNSGPRSPNESGSSFVAGIPAPRRLAECQRSTSRTIRQTEIVRRPVKPASAAGLCPREKWICPREKCRLHTRKTHARRSPFRTCTTSGPDLGSTWREHRAKLLGRMEWPEDSEDRGSAGGHGNQHVCLRGAQVDRTKTVCPARSAIVASGRGRRPPNELQIVGPTSARYFGRQANPHMAIRSGRAVTGGAPPCPGVPRTSRSGVAISRSWLLHCGSALALPSLSIHPLPSECECQRVPIRSGR